MSSSTAAIATLLGIQTRETVLTPAGGNSPQSLVNATAKEIQAKGADAFAVAMNVVDEAQVENLEKKMNERGYLEGSEMASTFNLLRGRDLIWNYVTNNYLLGADYMPFDLLHWNGDTTNLPAKWHLSYLTDLYRDNLLVQPGAMSVVRGPSV